MEVTLWGELEDGLSNLEPNWLYHCFHFIATFEGLAECGIRVAIKVFHIFLPHVLQHVILLGRNRDEARTGVDNCWVRLCLARVLKRTISVE